MLTKLRLTNFKSWADTGDIRLAPITCLFGANSSGKTSLIQSLLLMKQTAASTDRFQPFDLGSTDSFVELGSFRSVVHAHNAQSEMSFTLGRDTAKPLVITNVDNGGAQIASGTQLELESHVRAENERTRQPHLVTTDLKYTLGGVNFTMRRRPDSTSYELSASGGAFDFKKAQGSPTKQPLSSKFYRFPDQVRASYQNATFLADLELSLENEMRRLFYLGPLRAYPERSYSWSGARPSDMGREGEKAVDALLAARDIGQAVSTGQGRRRASIERYVAHWLQLLGLVAEFEVRTVREGSGYFEVRVRRNPGDPEVLITDVGFGVSQILPVLVLCFYVEEGATIILEQPEIHLHPAVQSGLADVLIDAVKKRKVQLIVESHSEHFLRRLQRRIADETIAPTETALYFCQYEHGSSRLLELQVDRVGNINNWPKDFFGDQFGELAATQGARIERHRPGAAVG